jgi:hypothetical protein
MLGCDYVSVVVSDGYRKLGVYRGAVRLPISIGFVVQAHRDRRHPGW